MKTVLVAGATGAVGSALVPLLRERGMEVIPHVRPKTAARHPLGRDRDALVCDLADAAAVDAAVRRARVIVSLVGTMRRRFAAGDTYQSSDVQPVVHLLASAARVASAASSDAAARGAAAASSAPAARVAAVAGDAPPHFLLLSSLGARAGGGYLGFKFRAEEAVRESGLPFAILRPSFLDSSGSGAQPSDGRQRTPPPLAGAVLRLLGAVPGMRGTADDLRPMPVLALCRAIARLIEDGAPRGAVLTGRQLWKLAAR